MLERVVAQIRALEVLNMASLEETLDTFEPDMDLIDSLVPDDFPDGNYHRRLIHQCREFEVVLATWPGGVCSPVHDHGSRNSEGVARVLKGSIFNRIFRKDGNRLIQTKEDIIGVGEVLRVPKGLIHAMGCHFPQGIAVSLHAYTPAIVEPSYWDPKTLVRIESLAAAQPVTSN